ncbi:hypothetical protein VTO42DRAFT_2375 [Malbranchea cinnamomea]
MARFVLIAWSFISCVAQAIPQGQHPLSNLENSHVATPEKFARRALHGRFLHITDIHPDSHYKLHSNAGAKHVCHSGSGDAGYLGAPGTDCDTPYTLVDETMEWIRENLRDSIDFVVWTGDSARHDNDENIPRTEKELVQSNEKMVEKLLDVFSDDITAANGHSQKRLRIPIVPNIGNNDIMPHNIFRRGPNRWTKAFDRIWRPFIPEEQRHTFIQGGWFYVEVIPKKLAVFSLNTMYFFKSNSAVDGCAYKSEPGYEQMDWLRVQLQLLRKRKMKAVLIGHVPPARTNERKYWYGSCWQKYALWLQQYRDVIVGSVYGHMNIDHFIIQDFHDLKIGGSEAGWLDGTDRGDQDTFGSLPEDTISIETKVDYLQSLRDFWSKLPVPPPGYSHPTLREDSSSANGKKKKAVKKFLEEIGGPWSERYALSLVSPSVIPSYYPTLRVIEYNVTGLEDTEIWSYDLMKHEEDILRPDELDMQDTDNPVLDLDDATGNTRKKRKKKKKKNNKFKIPESPAPEDTPGPAYLNQPFTWLGYTQYFANITKFNAQIEILQDRNTISTLRDYIKKHGVLIDDNAKPKIEYEVEYDTSTDHVYKLRDMTVNSFLDLARKMAKIPPKHTADMNMRAVSEESTTHICRQFEQCIHLQEQSEVNPEVSGNRIWKTFLRRAFVGFRNFA